MSLSKTTFSLQKFLAMPDRCNRTELVNGEVTPKVSPKYKHASVQGRLFRFLIGASESNAVEFAQNGL